MRVETSARELALRALYQHDLLGDRSPEEPYQFCRANAESEHTAKLAIELLDGCLAHREEVDETIRATAENWELKRMAVTDRNILRLGVFELLYRQQTPPKVAINEAIELAKKYSTENSPTFVNGVLDKIYNTHVCVQEPETAQGSHAFCPTLSPDPQSRADLHVHSTASDGSVPPTELAAMAAKRGLAAFALTDHDSVEGVAAAREAAAEAGVELISGVELTGYRPSADGEDVEVHVAGLFVDTESEVLLSKLRELRDARERRVSRMVKKLGELGVPIEEAAVLERAAGGAVGRVHVAQELAERGHVGDIREAFDRFIGEGCPAYAPKEKLSPAQAIQLVLAAGGCSVLCHPGLLSNLEQVVAELAAQGLDALEVHYPHHSPYDEKRLMEIANGHALAVTGGSDFHGEAKPDIVMGQEFVSFVEVCELQRRAMKRR